MQPNVLNMTHMLLVPSIVIVEWSAELLLLKSRVSWELKHDYWNTEPYTQWFSRASAAVITAELKLHVPVPEWCSA
jgi:hypothetical protein